MREFYEQGVKVSAGSISNIINAYKRKHEQPLQSDTSGAEQASIITHRDGGPLSNFLRVSITRTTEGGACYRKAQSSSGDAKY